MKYLIGSGLACIVFVGLAAGAVAQGEHPLVGECRATEVTMPNSCGCTVTNSRQAGISESDLSALFKDDAQSTPVSEQTYQSFWLIKSQCMLDVTMTAQASGSTMTNVPRVAGPGPALAAPSALAPAAPRATAQAAAQLSSGEPDYARGRVIELPRERAEALMAQLRGTAWEMTEADARDGWKMQLHFRPDGVLVTQFLNERGEFASSSAERLVRGDGTAPGQANSDAIRVDERGLETRREGRLVEFAFYRQPIASPTLGGLRPFPFVLVENGRLLVGESGRHGYMNREFRMIGDAAAALPAGLSAPERRAATIPGPLANRFGWITSEVHGEAECTADLLVLPEGAPAPRDTNEFSTARKARAYPLIGTILMLSGEPDWQTGMKVMFDGTPRVLPRVRGDMHSVAYSDGILSLNISHGETVTDNPAYGYSVDDVEVRHEGRTQHFTGMSFNLC
ncbi:hypothetical protein D6851_04040 [Altericroceibacterium spongiae]|uniref:DUF1176 domain-containing protein n=1 Tax=Altericroceibacterium spongiae TaxID=2320269 RepID=A0A420EP04_9SPHN|nr:hypothetical protein [Altericroceibacterium spongiae]RKF22409.1 hypothetical protein D6851_04040 [Altericroceibacterium spongiae]|tara:strand:- start:2215 stop:3573 length:1359 start_codon:yes stop_codon:yes gene_type:complete